MAGMTGKAFFAEFQAKCLCLFHGQAVVGCISWVKADDILVTFDITMLGVLAILAVCQQTGRCKREIATLKGVEQVRIPQLRSALFIQKLLSGERVVLVNEVRFDGGIVRVFITIRLFKSLATTSNCMSQICGLWLNNAAALATEAICLSVAIQFTQNFLGVQRNAVRSASSSRSFARICSVSAPPELKCLASWFRLRPPCCTEQAGWKQRSGFLHRRRQR